jgi:hypothetical protein
MMSFLSAGLFHISDEAVSFGGYILESNLLNLILLDASLFYLLGSIVSEKLEGRIGGLVRRFLKLEGERKEVCAEIRRVKRNSLVFEQLGGCRLIEVKFFDESPEKAGQPLSLMLKRVSYIIRIQALSEFYRERPVKWVATPSFRHTIYERLSRTAPVNSSQVLGGSETRVRSARGRGEIDIHHPGKLIRDTLNNCSSREDKLRTLRKVVDSGWQVLVPLRTGSSVFYKTPEELFVREADSKNEKDSLVKQLPLPAYIFKELDLTGVTASPVKLLKTWACVRGCRYWHLMSKMPHSVSSIANHVILEGSQPSRESLLDGVDCPDVISQRGRPIIVDPYSDPELPEMVMGADGVMTTDFSGWGIRVPTEDIYETPQYGGSPYPSNSMGAFFYPEDDNFLGLSDDLSVTLRAFRGDIAARALRRCSLMFGSIRGEDL